MTLFYLWRAAWVTCELCGKRWVAVFHVESVRLECPGCEHFNPVPTRKSKSDALPPED